MFGQKESSTIARVETVRVAGEVDMATLPMLEAALEVLDGAAVDAVIDMEDLTFIDVGGLRVLVRTSLALRARGCRLSLRGVSPAIRRVLEALDWVEVFSYTQPAT